MQEVEALRYVNLVIFCLDPCELIHDLIAPFVEAFVPDVHLRIQYPEETKALLREDFDWNIHDLRI
jgi:hypothetical protein